MRQITPMSLAALMPSLTPTQAEQWAPDIQHALEVYRITSTPSIEQFMATVAHECSELQRLEENLNYSAKRLTEIWPSLFKTIVVAAPYARNPEKLANRVYANRMGNGPESSGDGYKYRGRGCFMLTGKANYLAYNPDIEPDAVAQPPHAILSAAWFWVKHQCHITAEQHPNDISFVTRTINGGQIGLAARVKYHKLAQKIK